MKLTIQLKVRLLRIALAASLMRLANKVDSKFVERSMFMYVEENFNSYQDWSIGYAIGEE